MYKGKKVIVVLPAYRAALTLKQTYEEIPFDLVDEVVLVDDKSPDNTVEVAARWASSTSWYTRGTAVTAATRRAATTRHWNWVAISW